MISPWKLSYKIDHEFDYTFLENGNDEQVI